MTRILVILTFFFVFTQVHSQSIPERANALDSDGNKQGPWIIFSDQEFKEIEKDKASFYRLITYESGQPKGKVKDYYINGVLQSDFTYISENPPIYDGDMFIYNQNGIFHYYLFYENQEIDYEKSLVEFQEILNNEKGNQTKLEYVASLDIIGAIMGELGRHIEATPYLKTMLEIRLAELPIADLLIVQAYYALGNYFRQGGELDSALEYIEPILEFKKQGYQVDDAYYSSTIDLKTSILNKLERYPEAIDSNLIALEIAKDNYGKTSEEYDIEAYNLANKYETVGNLEEAKKFFTISSKIDEKLYGEYSEDYAKTLSRIAVINRNLRLYNEAENQSIKVIEIRKKVLGESNLDYAKALLELAVTYDDQEFYSKAEPLYLQAKQLFQELDDTEEYFNTNAHLAILYKSMEKFDLAKPLMLENFDFYQRNRDKDTKSLITTYFYLAGLYNATANFEQAEMAYKDVLPIAKDFYGEVHISYAIVLNSIGLYYLELDQYAVAEEYLNKSMTIKEKLKETNPIEYASTVNTLGMLYEGTQRRDLAEAAYKKALEIQKKELGTNNSTYATSLNNLAGLHMSNLNYKEAIELYNESIEIYERINQLNSEYAYILSNLGNLYLELTEYAKAEEFHLKALHVRESNKKSLGYAASLNNLGALYSAMGQFERAEPMILESVSIRKEKSGTNTLLYGAAVNNLGAVYDGYRKYPEAKKMFQEGLISRRNVLGDKHPVYAESLNNLADVYSKLGDQDSAQFLLEKAIEVLEFNNETSSESYALYQNNLGAINKLNEDYEAAEKRYLIALNGFKNVFGDTHRWISSPLLNLAILSIAQNDYEDAESYLAQSQDNLLRIVSEQFPSMNEAEKKIFWSLMSTHFELYHVVVLELRKLKPELTVRAYDNILATKGLLLDASTKMKRAILYSKDTILIQQYEKWSAQRQLLAKAYTLKPEQRQSQNIDVDALRDEINLLEKELSKKSQSFAENIQSARPSWKSIKNLLKPNEAAIELVRFQDHDSLGWNSNYYYAAYIITNKSKFPELVMIDFANRLEVRYLKLYSNNIKYKLLDEDSYKNYWRTLSGNLEGIEKIYLSTEGVYSQISLNTLYNDKTEKYLLDEIDIQLVTSTRELLNNRGKKRKLNATPFAKLLGRPDYLIEEESEEKSGNSDKSRSMDRNIERMFGSKNIPDLPGTETEIKNIEEVLKSSGWRTESHFFAQATEDEVKSVKSPKVMHIATHGFFLGNVNKEHENQTNSSTPDEKSSDPMMLSGILLAGVSDYYRSEGKMQNNDGILTAYEATSLNLDETELVVLSACETGLGDVSYGEGVYGLQRGFEVAGAESILMSLWKVSDEATQELMSAFYAQWIETGNKRLAFRKAQEAMKKKYTSPYYWGAFVMTGK